MKLLRDCFSPLNYIAGIRRTLKRHPEGITFYKGCSICNARGRLVTNRPAFEAGKKAKIVLHRGNKTRTMLLFPNTGLGKYDTARKEVLHTNTDSLGKPFSRAHF